MTPTPADLTYQLNALLTAARFRMDIDEGEVAAFVEGMLAASAKTPPKRKPIRRDYGDKCPGHAKATDRPCDYDPSGYAKPKRKRKARK
jgi:hypothetical protein